MTRNVSLALLIAAFPAVAGDPGHVYFQRLAEPSLDRFTNSPDSAGKTWLRDHFFRMAVFSPYFDPRTKWYPQALFYRNLYGVPTDSRVYAQHPDWVLHDSGRRPLYIPWGCKNGVCPQYAGDIANPAFREWWIGEARATLARGYFGIWIDDVNMEFRVSDGNSVQATPIDTFSGRPMSAEAWRGHVADFVEQIRSAFPKVEIVHNSLWFAGPDGVRDKDPAIRRQIAAADNLNIERGIASDQGLKGGNDIWSLNALFAYIDRVHEAGRGVTLEEYSPDRAGLAYSLAGYFLISSGNDRIGDATTNPANWWNGFDIDLGAPSGPRSYHAGVFQRAFTGGMVLLGEPGLSPRKVSLPGAFVNPDGQPVTTVEVHAREGVILRKAR